MSSWRWRALPARYSMLAEQLGLPCAAPTPRRRTNEPSEFDHQVELVERNRTNRDALPSGIVDAQTDVPDFLSPEFAHLSARELTGIGR